jgi:heme exporter protein B
VRAALVLLRRDLALILPGGGNGSAALLPVLFFLAVAMIFPFAVGPDQAVLAQTGGGACWIAALLAAILPMDRLIAPDLSRGFFDQTMLRGISDEMAMSMRLVAHWVSFGPPLLIATLPAAALLGLSEEQLRLLWLGLLAGTPGLAALALTIAALTATLRGGAALGGLLLLPLAIPLLIFGAGGIASGDGSAFAYTAACSLVLVAAAPFIAGAAIRSARER